MDNTQNYDRKRIPPPQGASALTSTVEAADTVPPVRLWLHRLHDQINSVANALEVLQSRLEAVTRYPDAKGAAGVNAPVLHLSPVANELCAACERLEEQETRIIATIEALQV